MAWYPDPKSVPESLDTEDLHLEMLAPKHVDIDHDAFMSSRERLLAWSGGRWPHEGFTRDENMKDMIMHRDEFLAREAFAYTVLNSAQERCEGCIYINPVMRSNVDGIRQDAALPESTAQVSWWVRDDALERDLDRQLIEGLVSWFPPDGSSILSHSVLAPTTPMTSPSSSRRPQLHRDLDRQRRTG